MRHEITTANTKRMIAESLKKLMLQKPLAKITVSEIIADCGINRKTFYYHFEDIYALLKWILEEEAIEVVKNFDLMLEPEEALLFAIDYVSTNKHLLCCAYDSIGQREMKRFFCTDFHKLVHSIIQTICQEQALSVPVDFKQFLTSFFTEALAGMLIDYFQSNDNRNDKELAQHLLFVLKHSIPHVLIEKSKNSFGGES